jgi:hypothetical protein
MLKENQNYNFFTNEDGRIMAYTAAFIGYDFLGPKAFVKVFMSRSGSIVLLNPDYITSVQVVDLDKDELTEDFGDIKVKERSEVNDVE